MTSSVYTTLIAVKRSLILIHTAKYKAKLSLVKSEVTAGIGLLKQCKFQKTKLDCIKFWYISWKISKKKLLSLQQLFQRYSLMILWKCFHRTLSLLATISSSSLFIMIISYCFSIKWAPVRNGKHFCKIKQFFYTEPLWKMNIPLFKFSLCDFTTRFVLLQR